MNIVKLAMIGEKGEKEACCSHMASLMIVLVGKTYMGISNFSANETLIALV